jgi:outer membrane protein assembly factor BamB
MRRLIAPTILAVVFSQAVFAANAAQILRETGFTGGIIVHIGCDDPGQLVELRAGKPWVVHGLDTDAVKVARAREFLSARKVHGPVSASVYNGTRLPYIDNLVNLVVADELGSLSREEVLRVLAPLGTAWIGGRTLTKPWPRELDEWPQYLHEADNNAVSRDTAVGPPRHMQWVADPLWSRSHMAIATVNSMVTARGRLFTIEDKATVENPFLPGRFSLVARDAFNGVVLWEHEFPAWEPITRYIKDMAVQLQRRLAAIGDKVYCTPGIDGPLTAFDASTGESLKVYDQTKETQEFVYHDNRLYAIVGDRMNAARYNIVKTEASKGITLGGTDKGAPFDGTGFKEGYAREFQDLAETRCSILAIDATTGKVLWKDADIVNYVAATLAIKDQSAIYMTQGGLKCLDARTGDCLWQVRKNIKSGDGTESNTLLISGETVYTAEGQQLIAYRLRDGRQLWTSTSRNNYEKSADLFVVGGVAWTGGTGQPTSHDPQTGNITKVLEQLMKGPMSHDRCYRNFITERYFINSKTGGADFVNLKTGQEFPNHWVRGTCGMGVVPANGMLYAPPYSCQCSAGAMITGFNALYTEPDLRAPDQNIEVDRNVRLIRGPAYSQIGIRKSQIENPSDWPVYRNDNTRGGANDTELSAALAQNWKVTFTGTPSAPIAADGKVFVADVDAYTVYALNAADGKILWSHAAGGRVDSPPAYYNGLVLFGSRDGWVHCLRAHDGTVVWRFKDLPDKLIGAFGRLESAWPVSASVLVKDDTVYSCAGRSSFLDGGMFLYALNAWTGAVKHTRQIYGPFDDKNGFPATGNRTDSSPGDGFKGDIMVSDGELFYLRHKAFNADLTTSQNARPHLIASAGFLDDTPQHRTYWTVNTTYSWTLVRGVDSDILVADGNRCYGVLGFRTQRHSYFDPRKSGYRLFAASLDNSPETTGEAAGTRRRSAKKGGNRAGSKELWSTNIPLTGKAIIKAGETICVAGTPMKFRDNLFADFVASYEQRLGGILWLASAQDGRKIAEYRLDAAPTWDAMAAANGRLFISLKDGSLRCFSADRVSL